MTKNLVFDTIGFMKNLQSVDGYTPWGKSVSIDLFDCPFERVSSKTVIQEYIKAILIEINMSAHGPTYIDRFGDPKSNLEGYSAMQFIETSSITIHCDEVNNRAFIDIFSCKDFDDQKATEFTKNFFEAKRSKSTTLIR